MFIRALCALILSAIGFTPAIGHVTAIHAGVLHATPGEAPLSEQTILVEDGRITEIRAGYAEIADATVIDLKDMIVLPGLIDSHVHLSNEWNPNLRLQAVTRSDVMVAFHMLANAQDALAAGFTTLQDLGSPESIFGVRDAIASGLVPGPRIRAAGRAVSPTGGHGDYHGYRQEILDTIPDYNLCDGAADCRRATREVIKRGADIVKITATGGVLSNTAAGVERQFFDDELEAIVQTAAQMGRKVTAHAHGKSGIDAAVTAGVASIEHGTYLDRASAALFRQNNAYLVPTMLAGATVGEWVDQPWLPAPSRAKAAAVGPALVAMVELAHEAGVPIAFGTDTGVSRHGENAREFALMVAAGMTPTEAIRTATINAADHLDLEEEIGRIAVGFAADIIAVDDDPFEDVTALEDVGFVMARGAVFKDR